MLRVIHCNLEDFKSKLCGKRLFIFGAGYRAKLYYEEWQLSKYTEAIVDNNVNLQGKAWKHFREQRVIGVAEMINRIHTLGKENCVLLITPSFYSTHIVKELDDISDFDNLETYITSLIAEYINKHDFTITKGKQKIPKTIHYCWFGGGDIPDYLQACIKTWREKCPDFEIIRWDESNYDISKNIYMKEAYSCKKWGFVPDYARLDIIYQFGGIYLDTDVEVLKNLNDLLNDDCFFSVEYCGNINLGSGFGAIEGNSLIKEMCDVYQNKHFVDRNGKMDLRPCQHYQNPVFHRYGFSTQNVYQHIGKQVIYPSEVFCPVGLYTGFEHFTERTYAVHHHNLSWVSEQEKIERNALKKMMKDRLKIVVGGGRCRNLYGYKDSASLMEVGYAA